MFWTVYHVLDACRQVGDANALVFCHLFHLLHQYSRCIAGALNGNVGVMKSVIGDITDDTNLAEAFVLISPVFSIGASIAYVNPIACLLSCSDGYSDHFMVAP